MPTLQRAVYKSKSLGLRVQIRPERSKHHPTTGDVIEVIPRVYAEFGVFGPERDFYNQLSGEMDTAATIIGGVFDLDAIAEERGWDADVKAQAERELDRQCTLRPELLQRVDYISAPAPRPWPTYDGTDPDKVIEIAQATGTSAAAAAYERENLERAELIEQLDKDAATQPVVEPVEPVVAISNEPASSDDPTRIIL